MVTQEQRRLFSQHDQNALLPPIRIPQRGLVSNRNLLSPIRVPQWGLVSNRDLLPPIRVPQRRLVSDRNLLLSPSYSGPAFGYC